MLAAALIGPAVTFAQRPVPIQLPEDPEAVRTVVRALEDLEADDEEVRTGAAMLLGKYPGPEAVKGLTEALADPSVRVRRAAQVSLLAMLPGLPEGSLLALIRTIGDSDVEMRRNVSGHLGLLTQIWRSRRSGYLSRDPSLSAIPGGALTLPGPVAEAIAEALGSDDPATRRNILTQLPSLAIRVEPEQIAALIRDPAEAVSREAIRVGVRYLTSGGVAQIAAENLATRSPEWKLTLIDSLRRYNQPEVVRLFESLAQSEDPQVAEAAQVQLFDRDPSGPMVGELIRALRAGELGTGASVTVIQALNRLPGDEGRELARDLARNSPRASVQAAALGEWFQMEAELPDTSTLLEIFEDSHSTVREELVRLLRDRSGQLPLDLVREMTFSRHRNVREGALALARELPPAAARQVLLDLMLDDDSRLRLDALQELARRRLPGWHGLLLASLRDPRPEIYQGAANLLLFDREGEGLRLLREWVSEHPESDVAAYIERRLGRTFAPTN